MKASLALSSIVVGWILVGALLVVFAPREAALDPDQARLTYGDAPTSFSAAPSGMLAFYRVLERLGYTCERSTGARPATDAALFVVEPQIWLSDEEARHLLAWVRAGGSLVYAPSTVEARVESEGVSERVDVPDPLSSLVEPDRQIAPGVWGLELGGGRLTLLERGAQRLSNETLLTAGIAAELGWLGWALEGRSEVIFDEARAGAMLQGGLFTLLLSGHYRWPWLTLFVAVGLAFWSAFGRERPIEEPALAAHGGELEHLAALSRSLERDGRERLARQAMLEGTRWRLKGSQAAVRELDVIEAGTADLERLAAQLESLEARTKGA